MCCTCIYKKLSDTVLSRFSYIGGCNRRQTTLPKTFSSLTQLPFVLFLTIDSFCGECIARSACNLILLCTLHCSITSLCQRSPI